jgi:hypothetical protein
MEMFHKATSWNSWCPKQKKNIRNLPNWLHRPTEMLPIGDLATIPSLAPVASYPMFLHRSFQWRLNMMSFFQDRQDNKGKDWPRHAQHGLKWAYKEGQKRRYGLLCLQPKPQPTQPISFKHVIGVNPDWNRRFVLPSDILTISTQLWKMGHL